MTTSTPDSTAPRRVLKIISIASILSLICGILMATVVFRVTRLDHTPPFARLYESELMRGPWRPISQYAICSSIQWLMEIQSRAVRDRIQYFTSLYDASQHKATSLTEQANQLLQSGDSAQAAQAQQLQRQAEEERNRAREYLTQAQRLGGPSLQRNYVTRYYKLVLIPVLALWIAVWISATYLPHEVRATNEIIKVGALIGVFHGLLLAILLILWSVFDGASLSDFYLQANLYHGQWTGLWLFPSMGVILTGYLFGTIAGWLAKATEQIRFALLGKPIPSAESQPSRLS